MSAVSPSSAKTAPPSIEQLSSSSRKISILFAALVLLFCIWALSLPLFPTQDGPMHKYYVHVIASLLSGSHFYADYSIRHPFPPYALHYAVLLGLSRIVSLDLSEKIFICLIFIVTAYGFRYCARSLGPSGNLLSLLVAPLLLHWSVVMGFLNYSLAIGLFFLAVGLWLRAAADRPRLWPLFALVVVVLTLTHPVPLLLLIAFCALDLLRGVLESRAHRSAHSNEFLRKYRWRFAALAFACLSFLYPLASANRSRSVSNLHTFGLHRAAIVSSAILYGLSPFDTRSRNLLVNGYRLGLYIILFGCFALALRGIAARWRSRRLRSSDTMLLAAILLLAAIPFLPEAMNGSDYFAQRLMIFPWLGAVAAAAGYARPEKLRRAIPIFAAVMVALVLLPAEVLFRPVAKQLAALEAQPLPPHSEGLAMMDPAMLKAVRVQHHLGFNPYLWSGVLPFIHADDVMLNSPWMDLTIMPLKAEPGHLLVNEMSSPEQAERSINGNIDLPNLPAETRSPLLAATDVVVYVAVPADVQQGLAPLTGESAASRYRCADHSWYLVCVR